MTLASEAPGEVYYSALGARYRYLLTGDHTSGRFFMFEQYVLPGHGAPPHVHSREDEAFYILDGEFEFTVNGKSIRVLTGGFLLSRRGEPHHFKNVGTTPGKLIITTTPAGLEGFFAELGTKLSHAEDMPIPQSDDDIARLFKIAPQYGLTLLRP